MGRNCTLIGCTYACDSAPCTLMGPIVRERCLRGRWLGLRADATPPHPLHPSHPSIVSLPLHRNIPPPPKNNKKKKTKCPSPTPTELLSWFCSLQIEYKLQQCFGLRRLSSKLSLLWEIIHLTQLHLSCLTPLLLIIHSLLSPSPSSAVLDSDDFSFENTTDLPHSRWVRYNGHSFFLTMRTPFSTEMTYFREWRHF